MKGLKKTKKIIFGIATPILALLLAFFILCVATLCLYPPAFLGRVLTHWDSSVTDYRIFPERIIKAAEKPYIYAKNIDPALAETAVGQKNLREFTKSTDTTSFLIVKNDVIVYEQYENGYTGTSVNTSFSMAKSVVSLLVGKAIEDGYLKSVTQPISDYLAEWKNTEIGRTTIEELLLMRSNIAYDEGFLWFGDDSLTYWHPNLRELALSHTKLTENSAFHYNNYHPLLLGMVLERSTGMSVSEYFEREIWQKIGAEFPASWSLDSEGSGFEKMESGINFRAVDFLKLGSMVLHDGYWNGAQIINKEWLHASTLCELPIETGEYENSFLAGRNIGYQYMWYCTSEHDLIAWGKSDQILYISPAHDTVILRTGFTDGGVSDWVETLKSLTEKIT